MPRMQPKMYRGHFIMVHKPACQMPNMPDPDYEHAPSRIDRFITIGNRVVYNIILLATLVISVVLLAKHTMIFPFWYCN